MLRARTAWQLNLVSYVVTVALIGLVTVLVGAALFGQATKGGEILLPCGDRIAAAMLAVLILCTLEFPGDSGLVVGLPLVGYATALAYDDRSWFSWVTLSAGLVAYVVMVTYRISYL